MHASDALFLLAGCSLFLAVVLPGLVGRVPVSPPLVLVAVGMALGLTDMPGLPDVDVAKHRAVVQHVTEVTVLVSLMGVGLALDRHLRLRDRGSWRTWGAVWGLLGITMPLSIAATTLLGAWWAGLPLASALLLGAVLAPTDPVLAGDVQVEGPRVAGGAGPGDDEPDGAQAGDATDEPDGANAGDATDEPDEVRFALTAEAGLNDGLAFPFVYAAIMAAGATGFAGRWGEWVGWYLIGRVAVGVAVGVALGWMMGHLVLRSPVPHLRLAERGEPLFALAALLIAYGAAQLAGGYGFVAVFACAMAIRAMEKEHEYHAAMHEVLERLERILTLLVLLGLGVAATRGVLSHLDAAGAGIAASLVFVVRPLAGWLGLITRGRGAANGITMRPRERVITAFFGVRGVGSLYYLAYALGAAAFAGSAWLWSTVVFTVILSVFVHGVAATPAMAWLERTREGDAEAGA